MSNIHDDLQKIVNLAVSELQKVLPKSYLIIAKSGCGLELQSIEESGELPILDIYPEDNKLICYFNTKHPDHEEHAEHIYDLLEDKLPQIAQEYGLEISSTPK